MRYRYIEPISIRFARQFMQMYFGRAGIPHGSRCFWVAGVQDAPDRAGCYLIAGVGGLQGVYVATAGERVQEAVA